MTSVDYIYSALLDVCPGDCKDHGKSCWHVGLLPRRTWLTARRQKFTSSPRAPWSSISVVSIYRGRRSYVGRSILCIGSSIMSKLGGCSSSEAGKKYTQAWRDFMSVWRADDCSLSGPIICGYLPITARGLCHRTPASLCCRSLVLILPLQGVAWPVARY